MPHGGIRLPEIISSQIATYSVFCYTPRHPRSGCRLHINLRVYLNPLLVWDNDVAVAHFRLLVILNEYACAAILLIQIQFQGRVRCAYLVGQGAGPPCCVHTYPSSKRSEIYVFSELFF